MDQSQIPQPPYNNSIKLNQSKPKKKKKFIIPLIIIFVLVAIFIVSWVTFLSPEAQSKLQYELYQQFENAYYGALRNDTYGGQTPEETLQMFISALKQGDLDLAAKYFYLNTNEKSEDYLTGNKVRQGLQRLQDEGRIPEVIALLEKAEPFKDQTHKIEDQWYYYYAVYGENGEILEEITFLYNKHSGVWKLDSI